VFDLLVGARAVQFASSILVAGAAMFFVIVATPALSPHHHALLVREQRQLDRLMLAGLGFAIVSGAIWLLVLAAKLGQTSMVEAARNGTAWAVLTDVQFGRVSELRFAFAFMLVGLVLVRRLVPGLAGLAAWAIAVLGIGFVASLAWCGHAGGGLGVAGDTHVANDAIHLATAAAWVGGLIPLLLLIRPRIDMPAATRYHLIRRFSYLALLAVIGLAASGVINTWFMLSGVRELIVTEYGRLVLIKVALFLTMLAFAVANRLWLTPRLLLTATTGAQKDALQRLCFFTTIEATLGLAVICVVAVLGQLPPATHIHAG
jgi:putative copper resistance protein D